MRIEKRMADAQLLKDSTAQLVKYDTARHALEAAHSIDEVKEIRDKAGALRAYAVQAKDIQMQNWAAEIRVRAERRAREMLKAAIDGGLRDRGKGGDRKSPSSAASVKPPTLEGMGITHTQSSKWQKLAEPKQETFEQAISRIKGDRDKELTTAGVLREVLPSKPEVKTDLIEELIKWLHTRTPNPAPTDLHAHGHRLLNGVYMMRKTPENEQRFLDIVAHLKGITEFFGNELKKFEEKSSEPSQPALHPRAKTDDEKARESGISNREFKRQAWKAAHPEDAGKKKNGEIDKLVRKADRAIPRLVDLAVKGPIKWGTAGLGGPFPEEFYACDEPHGRR